MKNSKKFLLTAASLASCSVFLLDTYFPVFAQDSTEDTQPTTDDPTYVESYSQYLGELKTFAESYSQIEPEGGLLLSTAVNLSVLPCMLLAVFMDWYDSHYVYDFDYGTPTYSSCCYYSKSLDKKIGSTFSSRTVSAKNSTFDTTYSVPVLSNYGGVCSFYITVLTSYPNSFSYSFSPLSFDSVGNRYISQHSFYWNETPLSQRSGFSYYGLLLKDDYNVANNTYIAEDRTVDNIYLPIYSIVNKSVFYIPKGYTPVTVNSQNFDFNAPGIIVDKVVSEFESQYPVLVDDDDWNIMVDNIPEFPRPGDYYDINDPFLPVLPNANTLPTLPDIDPSESSIIQPMLQGSKTLFGLIGSFIKDSGLLPWILIIVVCSIAWFFLRW